MRTDERRGTRLSSCRNAHRCPFPPAPSTPPIPSTPPTPPMQVGLETKISFLAGLVRSRPWPCSLPLLGLLLLDCQGPAAIPDAPSGLALPIACADLRHEVYGIWPFGIH